MPTRRSATDFRNLCLSFLDPVFAKVDQPGSQSFAHGCCWMRFADGYQRDRIRGSPGARGGPPYSITHAFDTRAQSVWQCRRFCHCSGLMLELNYNNAASSWLTTVTIIRVESALLLPEQETRRRVMTKRILSLARYAAIIASLLLISAPTAVFAQGRGRGLGHGQDKSWKCRVFVNCHDARDGRWDGRWDGRGPNRGHGYWRNGTYVSRGSRVGYRRRYNMNDYWQRRHSDNGRYSDRWRYRSRRNR